MMKYRIVQMVDGIYRIQYKKGFTRSWEFYHRFHWGDELHDKNAYKTIEEAKSYIEFLKDKEQVELDSKTIKKVVDNL